VVNGLERAVEPAYTVPVVFGTLTEQSGPVKPGNNNRPPTRPLSGVVTFVNGRGYPTEVTAGANGSFVAPVPAGTYRVTARSPQIEQQKQNGTRTDPPCAGPTTVIVQSRQATQLALVCYVP
jgi:hypothetical protein